MNNINSYIRISPDFDYLFIDGNGCCSTAYGDEISNEDFSLGPRFRIVIPGIEEWHRRYVNSTDFAATKTDESFDWLSWHYEGLLFAKEIKRQLPSCFKLLYNAPFEDVSRLVPKEIEIDDGINKLLSSLEVNANTHYELGLKNRVVFSSESQSKGLSLSICVGKLKTDLYIPQNRIDGLKSWLLDILKGEKDAISLELPSAKLIFFQQRIGNKAMGQFWHETSDSTIPEFAAYVNKNEFVADFSTTVSELRDIKHFM